MNGSWQMTPKAVSQKNVAYDPCVSLHAVYEHFGCIGAGAILKVEGHTLSGANFNSSQLQLQFIELISNHASIFGFAFEQNS